MERRNEPSDRADQFHSGRADNDERRGVVVDISELRDQLAHREEEAREAARQREVDRVEELFGGQSHNKQESTLRSWVELADREIPDVERAREIWEHDRWDPDAKAWRETSRTLEWEKEKVGKTEQAIENWYRDHPVKSLLVRAGIQNKPRELESLEQEHSQAERFLQGSQQTLDKLERSWSARQPEYEQKLENEGRQIEEARENLKVIEKNPNTSKKSLTGSTTSSRNEFSRK